MRKLIAILLLCFSQISQALPAHHDEIMVPSDGNCLYWSLSAKDFSDNQIGKHEHRVAAQKIKRAIVKALKSGRYDEEINIVIALNDAKAKDKASYIQNIASGKVWPGDLELQVASDVLKMPITVYFSDTSVTYGEALTDYPKGRSIALRYAGKHYNYLREKV